MQRFDIDSGLGVLCSTLATKHARCPFQQLGAPRGYLVGMDIKLLRQFGQRLLALQGSQSHLRLERRAVIGNQSDWDRLPDGAIIS